MLRQCNIQCLKFIDFLMTELTNNHSSSVERWSRMFNWGEIYCAAMTVSAVAWWTSAAVCQRLNTTVWSVQGKSKTCSWKLVVSVSPSTSAHFSVVIVLVTSKSQCQWLSELSTPNNFCSFPQMFSHHHACTVWQVCISGPLAKATHTGRTSVTILTIYTWYDVFACKDVPVGVALILLLI